MTDIKVDSVKIVADGKYYRVHIVKGSHKFHSEKLNLDTAIELHFELLTGRKP